MTGMVRVTADFNQNSVRALQKRLKEIDPKLRTQLVRDAKAVGKPLQSAVKTSNQRVKPLQSARHPRSNMDSPGEFRRLVWGSMAVKGWGTVNPQDVKVQFRTAGSKRTNVTSLLRLAIPHPLMAMAQYAGRSGRSINKGYRGSGRTRVYKWMTRQDGHVVETSHAIRGQGRAMINAWHTQGRAYKAVEHAMPAAKQEVQKIIHKYEKIASDR
jgi:hypothetical protein